MPVQNSQEELQESSDVVYAELDKSILGSGTKPVDVESTTEYAEIIPQQHWKCFEFLCNTHISKKLIHIKFMPKTPKKPIWI